MSLLKRRTQKDTFIGIETELGPDVLLLEGLRGVERMSRLFHYDLDLLSEAKPIDFNKIVGKPASIRIDGASLITEPRYIHGYISQISQLRDRDSFLHYRAELVPWPWFLTRTTDCQIYQEKSVTDIIEQVCKEHNFSDIEMELEDSVKSTKLDYCVQYRESDFNFISRLMEHHGISYYFKHQKDKHILVLTNQPGKYPKCHGATLPIHYKEDSRDPGVITDLTLRQDVRTAKVVYRDYHFETPDTVLEVGAEGTLQTEHGKFESYDYHPGRYKERGAGESLVKQRMDELEGTHRVIRGSGTFRGLEPGHQFELTGHPRADINAKYVVLEVWHDASAGGYVQQEASYHNEFVAAPVDIALRPAQVTPRPIVEGPQTAVVVGPDGEEIYTDDEGHGRIKVQFHWDRLEVAPEKRSCWVRVSQGWAGGKYGFFFLPRIGHEVIVDFLEGDPDQPIVTGAVYNGKQKPPYDLPTDRSKTTIKTNSYKGDGYNELRFEDKAGKEEIFIHAQKDFNEVVEHDHTTTVKNNQVITITGHQTISIKGEGQSGTKVDGKEVKGSSHDVTGSHVINASDTITIKAPNKITLECGGSTIVMVPDTITITSGGGAKITLTGDSVTNAALAHINATSKAQVDAPTIETTGPTTNINGDNIKISGSATVKAAGAGASLSLDGNADLAGGKASIAGKSTVSVSGGASAEIAAALVKIN